MSKSKSETSNHRLSIISDTKYKILNMNMVEFEVSIMRIGQYALSTLPKN